MLKKQHNEKWLVFSATKAVGVETSQETHLERRLNFNLEDLE